MKLTTIEVKGTALAVHVEPDGRFYTNVADAQINAKSLEELTEKASKALANSSVRVSIPVVANYNGKIKRGTFTGIHAANGNYLLKWEGERGVEQIGSYTFGRDNEWIDPAYEAEYAELCKRNKEAADAVYAFRTKHGVDVPAMMKEALNKEKAAA